MGSGKVIFPAAGSPKFRHYIVIKGPWVPGGGLGAAGVEAANQKAAFLHKPLFWTGVFLAAQLACLRLTTRIEFLTMPLP